MKGLMGFRLVVWVGLCLSVLFSACSREEEAEAIRFNLELVTVGSYSATIEVRHNGTNRDSWYGFVAMGFDINVLDEIDARTSTPISSGLLNQKKRLVHLISLSPEKEYTYIVVGVDETGKYNGRYGFVKFTTQSSSIIATLNPNWSVSYKGQKLYGQGYYSHILVRVTGSEDERYIMLTVSKNELENYSTEADFLAYATETYSETYNSDYDEEFWIGQGYNASVNFYRVLDPGDYYAYAIGVDATGKATGHYAKSDIFSEIEYPRTPGYSNMIGNWRVIDANGLEFTVRFIPDKVNRSLKMSGWGGRSDLVKVDFFQSSNGFAIDGQILDTNARGIVNNQTFYGNLILKGWYYNDSSTHYSTIIDNIAIGRVDNGNNSSYIIQSGFNVYNNNGYIDCPMGIVFLLYSGNDIFYYPNTKTQFPIQMTKK